MKKTKNQWVIHIWGKKRDKMELTNIEKFHFDMIRNYDLSIFDSILVNIAMDDIEDPLFDFLSNELRNLFPNSLEIFKCQNDKYLGEAVTFKPYVLDRIGEDVRIFYSHFKGYYSNIKFINSDMYPRRNVCINEMYWSYLMYKMNLDKFYLNEMKKSFDMGKDVYCWCLLEKDTISGNYYQDYFTKVKISMPDIENYFDDTMKITHSPGSFCWYNMKKLGEHLKDKLDYIQSYDIFKFRDDGCATHLCELYIWQFLNKQNVQIQTFINNMNEQWKVMGGYPYTRLFTLKKFCKEYLQEFERYIIQKQII